MRQNEILKGKADLFSTHTHSFSLLNVSWKCTTYIVMRVLDLATNKTQQTHWFQWVYILAEWNITRNIMD